MTAKLLTPEERQALISEVLALEDAGYAILPIKPDASRSPSGLWGDIAAGRVPPMPVEELVAYVESGRSDGIGLIMGVASGNAEAIELEGRVMSRFEELVEHALSIGVDELLQRLFNGFVDWSPSGGLHFHYRVVDDVARPNTVFARRPDPDDAAKTLVLAETRGQGGYMICAPSGGRTHGTGLTYKRVAGGPATTPMFTRQEVDELYRLFRYLDEMPPKAEGVGTEGGKNSATRRPGLPGERLLPGDDFNARASWKEILGDCGWAIATTSIGPDGIERTHWRRPGKAMGISATTFGEDGPLYVFSTSTTLPADTGITKFAAHCHLHHDGDFGAAARGLAEKGYGATAGGVLEYKPFPVDVLPEPLRRFVADGAEAANCDSSYIALPALTALAAAIGTSRRLVLKRDWKPYPIIWTGLIGESGNHKSVGRRIAIAPVAAMEAKAQRRLKEQNREYEARLVDWQREQKAWEKGRAGGPCPTKPTPPVAQRFVVDNVTIEALAPLLLDNPRGLLLPTDELGGWFGLFDRYASKGKADSAAWLSMYNAESMRIDRKTGSQRALYVPRASVCITGGIPPGSLQRVLGVEHRQSGLAARFLWAFPPRQEKTWTDVEVQPEAEAAYAQLFEKLYSLQPVTLSDGEIVPVDVGLTADARILFGQIYNQNAKELAELRGDLAALWSKLEETTARLALLIHFVRWAGGDKDVNIALVDEKSVEIGGVLVDWFKYEANRVYATLLNAKNEGAAQLDDAQEKLLQFIRGRGGVVESREVQQGCRWLKTAGKAKAALQELVEAGLGDWQEPGGEGPKARGRRFALRELASGEEQGGTDRERAGGRIVV